MLNRDILTHEYRKSDTSLDSGELGREVVRDLSKAPVSITSPRHLNIYLLR